MTREQLVEDLEAFLARRGRRRSGARRRARLRGLASRRPRSTPAHPLVTALREASGIVLGDERPVGVFPGATDAPHFQLTAGIPTVAAFGPGLPPARARAERERAGRGDRAGGRAVRARRPALRRGHDGRRRARARLRGRLGALPARRARRLLPGRGRGDGRGAARRDGRRGRRPRGARAAHAPRRVRRATASSASRARFAAIGVQGPGPVDVDAYRRRREAARSPGAAPVRARRAGARAASRPSAARGARAAGRQALVLRRARADAAARARARASCRS